MAGSCSVRVRQKHVIRFNVVLNWFEELSPLAPEVR
jgi:hypothetical protein